MHEMEEDPGFKLTLLRKKKDIKNFLADEGYMETIQIKNYGDVKLLIESLGAVQELGCYLTEVINRFDNCPYVLFNIRNVLVVIELRLFPNDDKLWAMLGRSIFANPGILKIFHDCSIPADYLYHRHGIILANYYDIKESVICQTKLKMMPKEVRRKQKKVDPEMIHLWDIFLPDRVPIFEFLVAEEFMLPLRCRKAEMTKFKFKFYALQVKYLLALKHEIDRLALGNIESSREQQYQSVFEGSKDMALEYFTRINQSQIVA